MKILKSYILFATGLFALTSCREDLCYDHFRNTAIELSYEQVWERDYGMNHSQNWDSDTHGEYNSYCPGLPETISMHAYSQESGESSLFFLDHKGGIAGLRSGKCDILLYNNDTEYVVVDDNATVAEMTATTTTRSRSTLTPLHSGERTVSPPDVLYGAYLTDMQGADPHRDTTITAVLRPLVYTYIIRYEFDEGLEFARLARGAIAGMAEKVRLKDGSTTSDRATVLFDCEQRSWGFIAKVTTFGVPSFSGEHYRDGNVVDPNLDFKLNLEVLCSNGKITTFEHDITAQVRKQPRGGVIVVKGLYLIDDDSQVDSGFDVSIDDWGEWTDVELPDIEIR
ncbi:MAG: DUF5119 domain-containing protein [Paramuribaculum sp.]|nr:DUF5119 domain-containing protein [Paramuribaculum sp.]